MKINGTQIVVGLALLLLAYRSGMLSSAKRAMTAAGSPSNPINDAAEWWSYAGSWQ